MNNKILYSISFLLIHLLVFKVEGKTCISLDTHVHDFSHGKEKNYLLAQKNIVKHFFLISNAYKYTEVLEYNNKTPQDEALSRYYQDISVSKAAQTNPNQITGLCSVNLKWKDAATYMQKCLQLPGMHGLKIHPSTNEYNLITYKELLDSNIESLINSGALKFLLIHMNLEDKYQDDLEFVIEIAEKHPKLQIIIAHGLGCPPLINQFSELKKKLKIKNLYLEISGTIYPDNEKNNQVLCHNSSEYKIEWIKSESFFNALNFFGIDQILYGSDTLDLSIITNYVDFEKVSQFINLINPKDAKKILKLNGSSFLRKIRPDLKQKLIKCN